MTRWERVRVVLRYILGAALLILAFVAALVDDDYAQATFDLLLALIVFGAFDKGLDR